jgi:predicted secreted protein
MPEALGRTLTISMGGTVVAGVQQKSVTCSVEGIDVSTDDDVGFRKFLSSGGEQTFDISFDGVEKDSVLRDQYMADGLSQEKAIILTWEDGSTVTGNFFWPNYEETGSYKDKITFSGSLQSSGPYVYVAAV